jgi:hypothetical protein
VVIRTVVIAARADETAACRSARCRFKQLRQLGDVEGAPARLVAGQAVRRHAPAGLVLEIDVGQRLAVGVADAEDQGSWEAT